MPEKKTRSVYLDLLRVLAMTGVICIHVSGGQFYNLPVDSPAWQAMNLWDGLARWAVPMFAMVSGAVFLDPQRRVSARSLFQKYIPRIILAFLVWSALYAAIHCQGSPRVFVTRLLRGHYHLWYLYMLAGFYLIVPILRRITASERLTWYFLALSAVFTFGVPDLILFAKAADRLWDLGLADIFTPVKQYTMFFLTLGFRPRACAPPAAALQAGDDHSLRAGAAGVCALPASERPAFLYQRCAAGGVFGIPQILRAVPDSGRVRGSKGRLASAVRQDAAPDHLRCSMQLRRVSVASAAARSLCAGRRSHRRGLGVYRGSGHGSDSDRAFARALRADPPHSVARQAHRITSWLSVSTSKGEFAKTANSPFLF